MLSHKLNYINNSNKYLENMIREENYEKYSYENTSKFDNNCD